MSTPSAAPTSPPAPAPSGDGGTAPAAAAPTTPPPASPAGDQNPNGGAKPPEGGPPAATPAAPTAQLGHVEGDGGGEPAKADKAAPAGAEVALPEGVDNPALLAALQAVKDDPTKLVAAVFDHHKHQAEVADQQRKAEWQGIQKEWVEAMKADPAFGGAKYAGNIQAATQALTEFWDKDFIDYVRESGLRNMPGFLKGLAKIGHARRDSTIAGLQTTPSAQSSEAERLKRFFNNSPEMFGEHRE